MPRGDFYTIAELAEFISSSPAQIRKWERDFLIPPATKRVRKGSRTERRYSLEDMAKIKELIQLYSVGQPTPEQSKERARRQAEFKGTHE